MAALELVVTAEQAGRTVKSLLRGELGLSAGRVGRLKRTETGLTVNGRRVFVTALLRAGDRLRVDLDAAERPSSLVPAAMALEVLYEDEHLLLADKRPGMVVHADETEKVNTLINHIQAYLYQKREWSPYKEQTFAPALCNRIDRNTGGIVIAAKNAEALRVLTAKIRDREITKKYLCVTLGTMKPPEGKLEGYIFKDEVKKQVYVRKRPEPGAKTAITLYKTLAVKNGLSLVECDLITGRTHQIRAQFSAAGHPLVGDGKYGSERDNKKYGRHGQALYSYKLAFRFTTGAGPLEALNGRTFQVEKVDVVEEYFGEERGN